MDIRHYLYENLEWEIVELGATDYYMEQYRLSTVALGKNFEETFVIDSFMLRNDFKQYKNEIITQVKNQIIQKILFFFGALFEEPVHYAFLAEDGTERIISNHIALLTNDEFHLIMEHRIKNEILKRERGF